ncbi:MAG TPA: HU family DNA-binding protein [Alphaproteobacteria bacterium]|nr:HU family DNA-binding protein [Alphaproteobacteria bacterium]
MNQAELITRVAKKSKVSNAHAKQAVQDVLSAVQDALVKGEGVRTTLGTFSISKRGARMGVNPKTGEKIQIKASRGVRFKASRTVKAKLNKR